MAETTIVQARGLYLGPSDPQTPPGAMSSAVNVVISRDGIVETRRGLDVVGSRAVSRVWPYNSTLIAHGTTTLSRSTDGITWTDYSTALAPPSDAAVRAIEAQSGLFLTTSDGIYRLDSTTVEPVKAGVPEALDLGLALPGGTGTAMPTDSQLGYRLLFGTKDDSGRLILGGPSSRAVIANSSGSTKDVTVSGTIPDGINATDHFVQVYRTRESGAAATDPGDEMGLIYEGAIPSVRSGTQLVRTGGTTVTATTSAAHGYSVGMQVRISPGGSVSSSAVSIGGSATPQRSTDNGVTWSSAGVTGWPAGTFEAICNGGGYYVAVGSSVSAYSADGLTWSTGTLSASATAIVYTGTRWVCSTTTGLYYSTDNGATWTAGSGGGGGAYIWRALGWNGNTLLAVGEEASTGNPQVAYSSDGVNWTVAGPTGLTESVRYGITWDPYTSRWVICGTGLGGVRWAAYSTYPNATYTFSASSGFSGTGDLYALANSGTSILAVGDVVYKSTNGGISFSTVTWSSGTLRAVYWDGTNFIANGSSLAATGSGGNPSSLTSRTITAGSYRGVASGGSVDFPAGEYTITATPLTTSFEYAQAGSNGTLTATQVITPLTVAITDTAPDGFFGAALYTNANQDGILNANSRPLYARELTTFRGSLFLAHVNTPAQTIINLLGTSGTNGLVANDTITVNGQAYTAKASESITNREFAVVTSGTAAANIRDTAASLVRVLNRSASSSVYAQDVSDPSGVPGQVAIWCRDAATTLTITVSRSSAWANASNVSLAPKEWKNGLVWSKTDQPDHFPKSLALVPNQIGSGSAKILRLAATRSSLFIFKEDGLWRLTGDAGVWDIQPFDPTVRLVAPESVAVLDNSVFALCEAGVLRVSDTGVSLVSRQPGACDIQPIVNAMVGPTYRDSTADNTFGLAYESDHKYLLSVGYHLDYGDGSASSGIYVYDTLTRAWTQWLPTPRHGCVLGDRLWFVGADNYSPFTQTTTLKERKTNSLTDDDLKDAYQTVTITSGGGTTSLVLSSTSGISAGDLVGSAMVREVVDGTHLTMWSAGPANGSATHYLAILVGVSWTPNLGIGPGVLTRFRDVRYLFDRIAFHNATATLQNTYSAQDAIALDGTEQGTTSTVRGYSVRVWPSIDASLGSGLMISFTHQQAGMPMSCSGLAITHDPVSRRTNR